MAYDTETVISILIAVICLSFVVFVLTVVIIHQNSSNKEFHLWCCKYLGLHEIYRIDSRFAICRWCQMEFWRK